MCSRPEVTQLLTVVYPGTHACHGMWRDSVQCTAVEKGQAYAGGIERVQRGQGVNSFFFLDTPAFGM